MVKYQTVHLTSCQIFADVNYFTKAFTYFVSSYTQHTFVNGQFSVFWAEERKTPDILKGPSCPRTGVMVELSTSFSTALNGCSKALTVCTVLQKERHNQICLKILIHY